MKICEKIYFLQSKHILVPNRDFTAKNKFFKKNFHKDLPEKIELIKNCFKIRKFLISSIFFITL